MLPPAPDVEVIFDDGSKVGIECRRYGEAVSKLEESVQYRNAEAAKELTRMLEARFEKEFGTIKNLKPCVHYKVGPNSTEPFIPKKDWGDLADELVEVVLEAGFAAGPIYMASSPMRSRKLVREHLDQFYLSNNFFSSNNYITTRATFDENAFVRIIEEKGGKAHAYEGDIWLLVHTGDTGTSWPSTCLAGEALHMIVVEALERSHFIRLVVYDKMGVATLRSDGGYDVYESNNYR